MVIGLLILHSWGSSSFSCYSEFPLFSSFPSFSSFSRGFAGVDVSWGLVCVIMRDFV